MFIQRINSQSIHYFIKLIGSDNMGRKIMNKKANIIAFEVKNISFSATMILKQEALSAGAEFATPKECILAKESFYHGVLFGTKIQLERIAQKCKIQPFGLKSLSNEILKHLKISFKSPKIMAILNLTPDSFFEESRYNSQKAIEKIYNFIDKKISFIDIGGASSRPGSELLDADEEIKRIKEVIQEIYKNDLYKQIDFSIDTYNPKTADFALSKGFKVVNDISGFCNKEMFEVCKIYNAKAVLMHSKGTPKNMQSLNQYDDLIHEIDNFFHKKLKIFEEYKIKDIILDIGFGFAKDKEQNLSLIKHLEHFLHFNYPLLIGASRKNTIRLITQKDTQNSLAGTLALHMQAIINGAEILRVHDVEEHLDMIKILQSLSDNYE